MSGKSLGLASISKRGQDPAAMVAAYAGTGARFAGVWDRPDASRAVPPSAAPAEAIPAPIEVNKEPTAPDGPVDGPVDAAVESAVESAVEPIDPNTRVLADGPNRFLAQIWDGRNWRANWQTIAICRSEADAWAQLKARAHAK